MTIGEISTLIGLGVTLSAFIISQVIQVRKSGEEKGRTMLELEYIKKSSEKTNSDLGDMKQDIKEDFKVLKIDFTKQMECAIKNAKKEVKTEIKDEIREDITKIDEKVVVLKNSIKKAHERIDKVVKEKQAINNKKEGA